MERKDAANGTTDRRRLLKGIGVGGVALTMAPAPAKGVSLERTGSSIPTVPDASLEIAPIQTLAPEPAAQRVAAEAP